MRVTDKQAGTLGKWLHLLRRIGVLTWAEARKIFYGIVLDEREVDKWVDHTTSQKEKR